MKKIALSITAICLFLFSVPQISQAQTGAADFYLEIPYGSNYKYWTITFEGANGTYEVNTAPNNTLYGWNNNSFTKYNLIPAGTYTVTFHNQSYGNYMWFDASIATEESSEIIYDTVTDNEDIVFENIVVGGDSNSRIDISITGPH